jgi:hypothetical protein
VVGDHDDVVDDIAVLVVPANSLDFVLGFSKFIL